MNVVTQQETEQWRLAESSAIRISSFDRIRFAEVKAEWHNRALAKVWGTESAALLRVARFSPRWIVAAINSALRDAQSLPGGDCLGSPQARRPALGPAWQGPSLASTRSHPDFRFLITSNQKHGQTARVCCA
jgi:hypothetical protein